MCTEEITEPVTDILPYFAYGSNMLRERLIARGVKLAAKEQAAWIEDYRLVFNKKSKDASSKANLMPECGQKSYGVLFFVDKDSLDKLNLSEGAPTHYQKTTVPIRTETNSYEALIYLAQYDHLVSDQDPNDLHLPWDWYLALILAGAQACSNMPEEWIYFLKEASQFKISANSQTQNLDYRVKAISQLKAAGHANWQSLLIQSNQGFNAVMQDDAK